MDKRSEQSIQLLDQQLNELRQELARYPKEELSRKPTPDSWSVFDNMHHMMRAEQMSLQYVQKKLSFNPELSNTDIRTAFRDSFASFINKLPLKRKAPKAVAEEHFPQTAELDHIVRDWRQQRQHMEAYLSSLPPELFTKEVYKHPFAGRLSLNGMLRFFYQHNARHRRQMRRALKQVKQG